MYGAGDATLLVLSASSLGQDVINALESAAHALGHVDGACVATLEEAGGSLPLFVAEKDPWAVVAIDASSIEALSAAFPPASKALAPDRPVATGEGYLLVAVPGFAECLGDQAAKRVAWRRLKAARHPANPLEKQTPTV